MEKYLDIDPHSDYVEGYNQAYVLMQEYRELADNLAKSMPQSERGIGFKDGREQYLLEKNDRMPKWLQNKADIQKDVEPEPDKDMDDYEPDR
ncbi:hypothetical protein CAP35_02050 [Chitinophagaceae bacterium IBVUCB1]|nr:hypothetical protein CAP35_02050 [Chitinophagaceae bacterium IBVUCB1]